MILPGNWGDRGMMSEQLFGFVLWKKKPQSVQIWRLQL